MCLEFGPATQMRMWMEGIAIRLSGIVHIGSCYHDTSSKKTHSTDFAESAGDCQADEQPAGHRDVDPSPSRR